MFRWSLYVYFFCVSFSYSLKFFSTSYSQRSTNRIERELKLKPNKNWTQRRRERERDEQILKRSRRSSTTVSRPYCNTMLWFTFQLMRIIWIKWNAKSISYDALTSWLTQNNHYWIYYNCFSSVPFSFHETLEFELGHVFFSIISLLWYFIEDLSQLCRFYQNRMNLQKS